MQRVLYGCSHKASFDGFGYGGGQSISADPRSRFLQKLAKKTASLFRVPGCLALHHFFPPSLPHFPVYLCACVKGGIGVLRLSSVGGSKAVYERIVVVCSEIVMLSLSFYPSSYFVGVLCELIELDILNDVRRRKLCRLPFECECCCELLLDVLNPSLPPWNMR